MHVGERESAAVSLCAMDYSTLDLSVTGAKRQKTPERPTYFLLRRNGALASTLNLNGVKSAASMIAVSLLHRDGVGDNLQASLPGGTVFP